MLMRLMLEALLGTMHDVSVRILLNEWSYILSPSLKSCFFCCAVRLPVLLFWQLHILMSILYWLVLYVLKLQQIGLQQTI